MFDDGSTCYRTKSEDDSGVVSLQYNETSGDANTYNPNEKEKSNAVVVDETSICESIPFKSIEHLKDRLCAWLDDTVEKLGGDKEVSSRVDDDGKLHLMVHDVVLSNPEETEIYRRAKQMGVTDSTAKDYIRTVIIQAQKTHTKKF